MNNRIARWGRWLHWSFPILAWPFRRRAIRQLARHRDRPDAVAHLVSALGSPNRKVSATAGAALRALAAQPAVDALIEQALTTADSAAAVEIVNGCGYRHSDEGRWLLYLALAGRFDDYLKEDFEFRRLRLEFRSAPAELQARIREAIVRSGDIRMNPLFVTEKKEKLLAELSDHDSDVLVRLNARNKNWDGLFRYFWVLPARHIADAVRAMRQAGWTPADADRAALLDKLAGLCAETGDAPKEARVSAPLNPLLQQWMAAGEAGEMARKSETNLRAKFKDDMPPPEQLAALGALRKAGKLTANDLAAAGRSPHWPVRMAAVAIGAPLEQPNDGAMEWFKRLTLVLDADAVWGLKPCQVTRDGLEALQERLGALPDKRVAGGLSLIEAVTAHYTAHDIEVEVGARVVVGEDSFEVEG